MALTCNSTGGHREREAKGWKFLEGGKEKEEVMYSRSQGRVRAHDGRGTSSFRVVGSIGSSDTRIQELCCALSRSLSIVAFRNEVIYEQSKKKLTESAHT